MNYVADGRLKDAESILSAAFAAPTSGYGKLCDGLTLDTLATVKALSGRLVEAEALEEQSLKVLGKEYPPNDPALLRPLQSLAQIQFEQREIAKTRATFRRLQLIAAKSPAARAVVHGLAAALLYTEGRYHDGEAEYLKSLEAWDESGRGNTTDAAAVLGGLATLYVADGRYREAGQTLDRAVAILTSAKDAVPTDWIKLLSTRAALHVRQRQWREAEADLGAAISAADGDTRLAPPVLKTLLANYAYVLRKDHHGSEARLIEARASALHARDVTTGVVDISELLAKNRR